jgi:FdhD protein
MARGKTTQVLTTRVGASGGVRPDRLVVEEPLEIRLDDHLVTTTMRTPGHDYELAVGFCHTDGLLAGATVRTVRYCATGPASETAFNVVTVSTGGAAPEPVARLQGTTSSCGLCGSASIDTLLARLSPLADRPVAVYLAALVAAAREVRERQELFESTGSIHAAAAFDPSTGAVDLVREDIGRHNAVDKVVGRLLLDDALPATGRGLFVSGRASFEIVQKAWAGGFGLVAAVSGPSALAVDTARAAGITLVGFLRGDTANVYAPEPAMGARAAV